jgi:hypothetical protein
MKKEKDTVNQQNFLRDAIRRLVMTREKFAECLGTKKRRLDNCFVLSESK